MIDDVMLHRAVLRGQFQAELISDGVEDGWAIEQFWWEGFFWDVGREFGDKCEGEVVGVFQAGLVDDRALILL